LFFRIYFADLPEKFWDFNDFPDFFGDFGKKY